MFVLYYRNHAFNWTTGVFWSNVDVLYWNGSSTVQLKCNESVWIIPTTYDWIE